MDPVGFPPWHRPSSNGASGAPRPENDFSRARACLTNSSSAALPCGRTDCARLPKCNISLVKTAIKQQELPSQPKIREVYRLASFACAWLAEYPLRPARTTASGSRISVSQALIRTCASKPGNRDLWSVETKNIFERENVVRVCDENSVKHQRARHRPSSNS